MAARQKSLSGVPYKAIAITWAVCVLTLAPPAAANATQATDQARATAAPARRIVSLVPALTEILFAIGAGGQVVGVSTYDDFPAEVQSLPQIGRAHV